MEDQDSPSRKVADAIRGRISDGELRPGSRVPSTRQLVRDFGVAMATASRALAILRDEGVVVTRQGSGTFVATHPPTSRRTSSSPGRPTLTVDTIVASAIAIADQSGLEALSMRRLAADLEIGPMTLYRHVSGREHLEHLLVRAVVGAHPLPMPGPTGWRPRLELASGVEWTLYRRHPWLAELVSLTRPLLVPELMAHTEWALRSLDDTPLTLQERVMEVMSLSAIARGIATSLAAEARAERETQIGQHQWHSVLARESARVTSSGRFPRLASLGPGATPDMDRVFKLAVTRYLDGLAARIGSDMAASEGT